MNGLRINSKDYVVVAFVEPQDIGMRFSEWPLHVTVLPWLSVNELNELKQVVSSTLQAFSPFKVKVMYREYFGQKKLPVMLLEKHPELLRLHNELLVKVAAHGWELQGRYTGNQYKPHVTRHHGRDAEGEILIDSLYIVEKLEQGYRKIITKVSMNDE